MSNLIREYEKNLDKIKNNFKDSQLFNKTVFFYKYYYYII